MWDGRYGEEGYAYGVRPNDFLRKCVDEDGIVAPGSNILCLCEGEGRNAVFLAERGHDVAGVDSSSVGLDKAVQLAQDRGVSIRTIVADLADFDYGDSAYDAIVGISCHVPPPVRSRMLESIPRALKPNGVLIMENYTPKQLEFKTGGPPVAEMMFSKTETETALRGKLKLDQCNEIERNVVEGKYHIGRGAVLQVVGRKE